MDSVKTWWQKKVGTEWYSLRERAMSLLQQEAELQEIVQLVGPDALPAKEQVILEGARIIREDFLQQNAFHDVDTYCPKLKQYEMMRIMMKYYDLITEAANRGANIEEIRDMKTRERLARMATVGNDVYQKEFKKLEKDIESEVGKLKA
jgi:V/A-type H+-transporting ATPase subunit A